MREKQNEGFFRMDKIIKHILEMKKHKSEFQPLIFNF